jgi:acetoin utilization protein AcuB
MGRREEAATDGGNDRAKTALVRDAMTSVTVTLSPSDDVRDAATTMLRERVRHLPVVDADNRVLGIVSEADLRTALGDLETVLREDDIGPDPWPVATVMTPHPFTTTSDSTLGEAARVLLAHRFSALPVVDDEARLVGIVTTTDLVRFGYADAES